MPFFFRLLNLSFVSMNYLAWLPTKSYYWLQCAIFFVFFMKRFLQVGNFFSRHSNDSIGVESSTSSDVFIVGERRFVGRCKFCFSIWRDVDVDNDEASVGNVVAKSRQIMSQVSWVEKKSSRRNYYFFSAGKEAETKIDRFEFFSL